MIKSLPLPIGTKIVAVCNIGSVKEGAPGIITGTAEEPFFWRSRPIYLCTFADNMRIAARPKEIDDYDHRYSLADLAPPDFLSVMRARTSAELAARSPDKK
jgi:hypothetical protein